MSEQAVARDWPWLVAILVVTALVYAKCLTNDFTYDDRIFASAYTKVGPNTMVVDDHPIGDYFVQPMGVGVQERSRGFRPLTVLSYAVTHRTFRERIEPPRRHSGFPDQSISQEWTDPAWPHHLLNIVLHVLATWLTYWIVRGLVGPGWPPLVAAVVFGLHALRSDPVCSIVGRGELFGFAFGAGAMLLHATGLRRNGAARWAMLTAAMLSLSCALLSKESALAWCALVPLYSVAIAGWRRQLVPALFSVGLPLAVFAVLYLRFLSVAVSERFEVSFVYNSLFHLSFFARLPDAIMVWGYGLYKTLAPFSLACDYGWRVFDDVGYLDWRFLLAAACLLAVLFGGLRCYGKRPLLFFAMAVFLGASFITSNVLVPIETIFGERLYYTPALALSLVMAQAMTCCRRVCVVPIAVWLVACSVLCVKRSFDWESNASLYEVDSVGQPRSVSMQINMARISRLRVPPDWDARQRYLERVLEIDERSFAARNELAADLIDQRRFDEAAQLLEQGLEDVRGVESVYTEDFEMRDTGVTILMNLGACQWQLDRLPEATRSFDEALRLMRDDARSSRAFQCRLWLMWLAWRSGDKDRAATLVREAESVFGQREELELQKGMLAAANGERREAVRLLENNLVLVPQSERTLLAWQKLVEILVAAGQTQRAVGHAGQQVTVLLRLGDHSGADRVIRRALRRGRSDVLLRARVWTAWADRNLEEVRRRMAALGAGEDRELALHRGMLQAEAGEARAAAATLAKVVPSFDPVRPYVRAWVVLAESLAAIGAADDAQKVILEACRRNPRLPIEDAKRLRALVTR